MRTYTRILSEPGRCDAIRFYTGQEVDVSRAEKVIAHLVQGKDVRVVSTDSIGPWRRDYASIRLHLRHCNVKNRGCTHGYENRYEHTYRSFLHLHEEEGDQVAWVIKLDFDSLFIPENWRRFLDSKNYCTHEPHYLGHTLYHRKHPFQAGAGFALSKAALDILARHLREETLQKPTPKQPHLIESNCWDFETSAEDYHLGVCLAVCGVKVSDGRDEDGKQFFMNYGANAHRGLKWRPESWQFKGMPEKYRENVHDNCCADFAVLTHSYPNMQVMIALFEPEGGDLGQGFTEATKFSLQRLLHIERSGPVFGISLGAGVVQQ
ncbi:hypothetical protein CYMTET_32204 [Cymbomonas tetramitiformis]|uniref:Uncharacterized protein n=1 Tax=Cymbomonas tetramitiformis TaxID=36881 RepID=A0AAE0FG49_9CHLO|nr:hypothetical protein CYMTET_32204 [Cymbomonas tetramitiformis]